MELTEEQKFFLTYIVPVISFAASFVASLISLWVAKRQSDVEKAKYNFDIKRYEKEIAEEIAKTKPLPIVHSVSQRINLKSAREKRFAVDNSVIRRGILKHKTGIEYFGLKDYFVHYGKVPKDEIVVDQVNRSLNAEIIIANISEVPLWTKGIKVAIRIRPKLPLIRPKLQSRLFRGYREWLDIGDEIFDIVSTNLPYSIISSILRRKRQINDHQITHNEFMKTRVLNMSTQKEITLTEPLVISPKSVIRLQVVIETTFIGERELYNSRAEPYAFCCRVLWGDEEIDRLSELERSFFRLENIEYNAFYYKVDWKDIPA